MPSKSWVSIALGLAVGASIGWLGSNERLPLSHTVLAAPLTPAAAPPLQARSGGKKPNILVIIGDDIGWYNPSIYNRGMLGFQTPNIDRIGKEGAIFMSWYGQQSCTAGRAAFITGQSPIRTGLTKVGLPGADVG